MRIRACLVAGLMACAAPDAASDDTPPVDSDAGQVTLPTYGDLGEQVPFAEKSELSVYYDGIFAIWWYPEFDHAEEAVALGEQLQDIRARCLTELGMADPPNPAAGFYYNVYIHHGSDDAFPEGWGNGQGTDEFGMPYLTLPNGAHTDRGNVFHEGFHVFQYEATAPGFEYANDSQWYVEASAQWFMADELGDDVMAFIEAWALPMNPQLTLWHSFGNEVPGEPTDWNYQVRQYGIHTWLYYLTSQAGVDPDVITDGFYSGTTLLPQAYHADRVGLEPLRGMFADWAARTTGGIDYLTPEQVARAQQEFDWVGDPDNARPYVLELSDEGTDGMWRPADGDMARGWSYNVVKVDTSAAASWTLNFEGDATGSAGGASHFELRWVMETADGFEWTPIAVTPGGASDSTVVPVAGTEHLYVVIASVPEVWEGNQTYGYNLALTRSEISASSAP